MASCRLAGDMPLVQGLITSVDCNVSGLVQSGYSALIGPGSQFQMALTVLLTLYVGILGIRLMLGLSQLRVGELTMSVAKIGIVLALATNWPIYQQLVVNVLYDGPQQLAAQILGGPSTGFSAPYAGLQTAFDELQASSDYYAQRTPGVASPFVGGPAYGAFALNTSSMIMLLSTLGVVLASKIVLTAVLAFGPVFIAFLLFDVTRGLFVGWLRGAVALALAPLFAMLALVFQLLLIQPHLLTLAEMRGLTEISLAPAVATLALTSITGGVSIIGLIVLGFIASGFRLPRKPETINRVSNVTGETTSTPGVEAKPIAPPSFHLQPRTASIAAAAAAMDRRDSRLTDGATEPLRLAFTGAAAAEMPGTPSFAVGGGARPRRGLSPFRSASSARRDR